MNVDIFDTTTGNIVATLFYNSDGSYSYETTGGRSLQTYATDQEAFSAWLSYSRESLKNQGVTDLTIDTWHHGLKLF